ncbi:MAG: phosphatase PAP2 family protein [Lachnospiraceae bacterium]|nr:phosphatase PAP2 family protein [Lachnospiraceae bacterium]
MQERVKKSFIYTAILFVVFVVFTICAARVDVKPLGIENTDIGFSTINIALKDAIGLNMFWYNLSKYIGYMAFLVIAFFAFLGLSQAISRKSLLKVDKDIYALGVFYIFVFICYFFFEIVILNYRPWDLGEGPEASFPSSHTLMAVSVFFTAALQFQIRIKNELAKKICTIGSLVLMVIMVIARFLSGVHWFTDIVGGILISAFLISEYLFMISIIRSKEA